MTTTQTTNTATETTLDELEGEEQQVFLEEVGTLVFQSALMRYLQVTEAGEAAAFETFVDAHVASESFMDELCAEYPEFRSLLTDEMAAFREDVNSLAL
jgi:hypothetical protein